MLRKAFTGLMRVTGTAMAYWPWGWVSETSTGAWQKNVEPDTQDTLLRNSAVYGCVSGIASDIAKLRIKLTQDNGDGIWKEVTSDSPFLTVLRKPNHYQNRIQLLESWISSKLLSGNTYALKKRDNRNVVNALYVLDPRRVYPLVAVDGGVYYDLQQDFLSDLPEHVVVPATEIIHDRTATFAHPLVGIPPMYACAISGTLANRISGHSTTFFDNRSMPGGVLTAPGRINDETAKRLKEQFEKNFSGDKVGRLAVLGDGLKFEAMQATAEASQLAEQLKLTVEDIARAFHYPLFKLGGPLPAYASNVEALIVTYYTDCLQILIESLELCLDEGLALPARYGTELDLDNLMRMDTGGLYKSNTDAVGGGWMAPDEARYRANLAKTPGGSTPYLQQQNFSLSALAKRDAQADPFAKAAGTEGPAKPADTSTAPEDEAASQEDMKLLWEAQLRKDFAA